MTQFREIGRDKMLWCKVVNSMFFAPTPLSNTGNHAFIFALTTIIEDKLIGIQWSLAVSGTHNAGDLFSYILGQSFQPIYTFNLLERHTLQCLVAISLEPLFSDAKRNPPTWESDD